MSDRTLHSAGALALLPFMVQRALSLTVFRALIERGLDLSVAYYIRGGGGYPEDMAEDLRAANRLIDLSGYAGDGVDELDGIVRARNVGLIIQTGAPAAYAQLPYIRERHPTVRIIDILYNKIGHTLNHFLYEACFDGMIVESDDMMRFIMDNSTKKDPGVRLVTSGIDLDGFAPLPIMRRAASGGLVVGYLGRMSPEKNPIGFIELAERLHARLPSLTFRMTGEGHLADQVRSRVAQSPIGDVLSFHGYASTAIDALKELDVLVVPSVLDGRPNVIMEASSCGVPVIGAPVGGIPELIHSGRNGYVLGPMETDAIVAILRGWIDDRSSLERIRATSRAVAEANFDRRLMLDRYESVVREFLPGGW